MKRRQARKILKKWSTPGYSRGQRDAAAKKLSLRIYGTPFIEKKSLYQDVWDKVTARVCEDLMAQEDARMFEILDKVRIRADR